MAANLMGKRIVRMKYRRDTALDVTRIARGRIASSGSVGADESQCMQVVRQVRLFRLFPLCQPFRARIVVDNHSRSEKQLSIEMSDTRRDDHTCLAFILPRC